MAPTRREFLKIAGVSAAGLVLPPLASVFASAQAGTPAAGGVAPTGSDPRSALTAKRWGMVDRYPKMPLRLHGLHRCLPYRAQRTRFRKSQGRDPLDRHRKDGACLSRGDPSPATGIRSRVFPFRFFATTAKIRPVYGFAPRKATFQRADGIVMMDYHRCIGCRFCMAACPYGSRSMNYRDPRPFIRKINPEFPTRTKGVVEKCNFCEERLAQGILPACVTACTQKALTFGDVEDPGSDIRRLLDEKFSLRRRQELGTGPQIYYIL